MLTRRSRKESDEKPRSKKSDVASPKTPKKNKTLNKSVTPRGRSKSANSSVRTRSRSARKRNQNVALERLSTEKKPSAEKLKKDTKSKKSVESKGTKISSTPIDVSMFQRTPYVDLSSESAPALMTRSMSSRLANDKPQLTNNIKIKNSAVEFGGLLGNLLLTISFPILVILSKIALKTKGILIPFPRGYLRYGNYFDQDVYIWSAALLIIQLIVSLVPLAKKTEGLEKDDSKRCYRFSGFMNFVVSALIVAVLEYYKFSLMFILDMVTKRTVPHVVSSVVFALIISTVLLVTDMLKKQISQSNKLNYFQNFFVGTSLNPTLGPINLKLALYRYSFLLTILFNYLVIMDSLKSPVNLHLYVVAGLQILYALDKLVFEFNLLPSFYLQKEKLGYWTIINLFLQPAINFLPIQILLAKKLPVNYIIMGISSILFLFGYLCQRYCDFAKYKFESSSYSVRRSYGGRKLTESGPWSYVKYPNYIGTIIAHFAVMLLTIDLIDLNLDSLLTSWPVFLYALYYIVTLSHRCVRISTVGQTECGYTWDQQFASKWNLIPKIY